MGPMPGEIMTLVQRILGNWGAGNCGKNDVIKSFWLLSRTTGFMEGGSFNLRSSKKREEGEIRSWKVLKEDVGEEEGRGVYTSSCTQGGL